MAHWTALAAASAALAAAGAESVPATPPLPRRRDPTGCVSRADASLAPSASGAGGGCRNGGGQSARGGGAPAGVGARRLDEARQLRRVDVLAHGEREAARRDVGRMRLVRSLEGLQTASRKVISLSKHHESQTARTTSRDTSTAIRCDGAAIAGPPAPRHRPLAPIAHNDRYLSLTLSHCGSARTCACSPPRHPRTRRASHLPASARAASTRRSSCAASTCLPAASMKRPCHM